MVLLYITLVWEGDSLGMNTHGRRQLRGIYLIYEPTSNGQLKEGTAPFPRDVLSTEEGVYSLQVSAVGKPKVNK